MIEAASKEAIIYIKSRGYFAGEKTCVAAFYMEIIDRFFKAGPVHFGYGFKRTAG
jgi:hypothetical protein